MIRVVIFLVTLFLSVIMFGQNSVNMLKGKVVDDQQEPLAYVTIIARDALGNAVESLHTNEDGGFEIQLQGTVEQLEFQYVGFLTKNISTNAVLPKVIQLEQDSYFLDDVVITAKRPTIKRQIGFK